MTTKTYLQIEYVQVSPFSLRKATASGKVNTSYLIPTPHCLKSTLIDIYSQSHSTEELIKFFDSIKTLSFVFKLPSKIVVNQNLYSLLKDKRTDKKKNEEPDEMDNDDEQGEGKFSRMPMFKEYVFYPESFYIILDTTSFSEDKINEVLSIMMQISYLGKKDSFVSYNQHKIITELPDNCIMPVTDLKTIRSGFIENLDDIYSDKKVKTPKLLEDLREKGGYGTSKLRNFISYYFPYQKVSTSSIYTMYEII